jgi:hypothetical protein
MKEKGRGDGEFLFRSILGREVIVSEGVGACVAWRVVPRRSEAGLRHRRSRAPRTRGGGRPARQRARIHGLFALITLLWVVGFGSYGVPRALGEAGSEVDDAEVDDSEPSRAHHLTLEYKEISS